MLIDFLTINGQSLSIMYNYSLGHGQLCTVGSFVLTKTNVYLEHRAAHVLSHFVYAHLQFPMLYGILTILYNMTLLLHFTRNTSYGFIYILALQQKALENFLHFHGLQVIIKQGALSLIFLFYNLLGTCLFMYGQL